MTTKQSQFQYAPYTPNLALFACEPENETPEAKATREAAEQAEKDKVKPSDNEAKLLKEVMEKKEALRVAQEAATKNATDLAAVQAQLKNFEGLDPKEIRSLLDEKKRLEEEKLAKNGEWDKLKAQMNDAHKEDIAKVRGEFEPKVTELTAQVGTLQETIANLTVGNSFGQSQFIKDELALTVTKARIVYGQHFEYKDGAVVAFDKPKGAAGRTMYVDGKGEPLGFEDAIKKIVEADPDRDTVIKSKLKPGASSGTQGKGTEKPGAETVELSGREKIAAGLKANAKKA